MIDLVMGAAYSYSALLIRPFLKSLRESGYDRDIVLFVDEQAVEEAKKWKAEAIICPKVRTLPHAERFHWLASTLIDRKAEGVFLADTRDVVFQRNPATSLPGYGLHVFEEEDRMTVGTCPYNSDWVRIGYGEATLQRMKDYPIICVGTICGAKNNMKVHLAALCKELLELQPRTSKPQDQSCHNVLCRTVSGIKVWNNQEGEVYTVGYVLPEKLVYNSSGVMNRAGVPCVVHQYDRHKPLAALYEGKFGGTS